MSDPHKYTIGWICGIVTEYVAAQVFLEEKHDPPEQVSVNDNNDYTLGRIGKHNVAIAVLPQGEYGTSSAAGVARDMLHSFPNIRIGLMVGIGGGAPSQRHDIRLGDVVVGVSGNGNGAVFQYDFGKAIQGREFQETGHLDQPPPILRAAVNGLRAQHEIEGHEIKEAINNILNQKSKLRKKYKRPEMAADRLYQSQFVHRLDNDTECAVACLDDPSTLVQRPERDDDDDDPAIHYGPIASANTLMRDASIRDKFIQEKDVLCFETGAAGLINHFPCLVIRGICDYADSHTNREWHGYAAMTAAAYAKDLLCRIAPNNVENERKITEITGEIKEVNNSLARAYDQHENHHRETVERAMTKEQQKCHQAFKTSTYEQHKNINPDRAEGTCRWILENPQYLEWLRSSHNDLLWISADPGCGKSVLAKSLIDIDLKMTPISPVSVCYFFFKDNEEQNSNATAFCAILHQLFGMQPDLIQHAIPLWHKNGSGIQKEVDGLWRILKAAISDTAFSNTICILDALDECRPSDQVQLIRKLEEFYIQTRSSNRQSWLKFLVTSRPYDEIQEGFRPAIRLFPQIHLRGEEENDRIREEISLVVKMRVARLGESLPLASETLQQLEEQLLQMEHRTYLWLHLAMDDIYITFQDSLRPEEESIRLIPNSVGAAYTKILNRIPTNKISEVRNILQIIVGARRPLSIKEMAMALGVAQSARSLPAAKAGLKSEGLEKKIRRLCGLFVFVNNSMVYLIHQTAREFLTNDIWQNRDKNWSFSWADCERLMSEICINLLDDIDGDPPHYNVKMPSLLDYAIKHWPDHVWGMSSLTDPILDMRLNRFYDTTSKNFALWYPRFWRAVKPHRRRPNISAIHLAAFIGHKNIIEAIIAKDRSAANESDGSGTNPLYWASECGHHDILQILLDNGAEVNAQGGYYGNALQAASEEGYPDIVQTLLDNRAEVNAQGGLYGNALQAASKGGYPDIVQILLDNGAEVNAQGGHYGNALQAASKGGYPDVVQILLDKGAEVNAPGGIYGNALESASIEGYLDIVQILLDNGAEINAQGGLFGNALQAASEGGYPDIVQTLLYKGAEVNAQDGVYGNALQAASKRGYLHIVQILLDNGAEVNARGGLYGNALQAASEGGYLDIVQILLDKGAKAQL